MEHAGQHTSHQCLSVLNTSRKVEAGGPDVKLFTGLIHVTFCNPLLIDWPNHCMFSSVFVLCSSGGLLAITINSMGGKNAGNTIIWHACACVY